MRLSFFWSSERRKRCCPVPERNLFVAVGVHVYSNSWCLMRRLVSLLIPKDQTMRIFSKNDVNSRHPGEQPVLHS